MPASPRKPRYSPKPRRKSTTVRIPGALCEEAEVFVIGEHRKAASLNELVVDSLKEKLRNLKQQSIDDAFAGMATDVKYHRLAQQVSEEFGNSDLHSLDRGETR
jgi:hypothetical protein